MTSADSRNTMTMNPLSGTAPEATVTGVATKWGMGGGTLSSVYGWFTSNEAVILIGILITVGGFIVNLIYQRRRDLRESEEMRFRKDMELAEEKRRQELHEAQLASLLNRKDIVPE